MNKNDNLTMTYLKSQNANRKTTDQNSNLKSSNIKIRAYKLSLSIITFVNSLPNQRGFWSMGDQLLRAVTSIGANIIEAQAASSRKEYVKYYEIALKSANETAYWLGLLKEALKIDTKELSYLLQENDELCKIIAASLLTLKNK